MEDTVLIGVSCDDYALAVRQRDAALNNAAYITKAYAQAERHLASAEHAIANWEKRHHSVSRALLASGIVNGVLLFVALIVSIFWRFA